jgi:hypothetical protein
VSDAAEKHPDEEIKRRVMEQLDALDAEGKRKVLDFSEKLSSRSKFPVERDTRAALLKYAGTISREDLDLISEAIEEGCEKVDEEGW